MNCEPRSQMVARPFGTAYQLTAQQAGNQQADRATHGREPTAVWDMAVDKHVDEALARVARAKIGKRRLDSINLYAEGLKGKFQQAKIALHYLEGICTPLTRLQPAESEPYLDEDLVQFYCDAFWAFLYSSLDVLAQLINQVRKYGMDEWVVDIKRVARELPARENGSVLQTQVELLFKCRAFTNLGNYRNCCLHRRQICIEHDRRLVTRTAGYTATGRVADPTRLIAENPLDPKPKMNQRRQVPAYLQWALDQIENHVSRILKALETTS